MSTFHDEVCDALGTAEKALDLAVAYRAEKTAAERAARIEMSEAIAALVENGLIDATEKQAAEQDLSTHAGTLQVLTRLARLRDTAPVPYGRPAGHSKGASSPKIRQSTLEGNSYSREAEQEWVSMQGFGT